MCDPGPYDIRQSVVALLRGQLQGFAGGCQRFGKTSRFGVGSGQRIKKSRILATGKLDRLLG